MFISALFTISQDMETIPVSTDSQMHKGKVLYTCNGILVLSLQKKEMIPFLAWLNLEDIMKSKIDLSHKGKYFMVSLM